MIKLVATMALSASLLAGCTLIPDYNRPALPVSAQWPMGAEATQVQTDPVAAIAWQEFFRSSQLQQVIGIALEHNRDLRLAALNVEAVRGAYNLQRASLLPDITGVISGNKQRISQNAAFNQTGSNGDNSSFISEVYSAEIAASYGLDFFGRLRSLSVSAQQDFLATQEAQKAVQVSLIAETANAYLQLLADKEILALTQKTLDAQLRSSELVAKRFDYGIAGKLEGAQSEIPLATARVNHALYTRLVQQDMNALAVLMGKENTALLSEDNTLAEVSLMENLPVGLPSEVLLLRPDIRQAEHVLQSENADIGAARAAFFPSITLTASIGESSGELTDLFTSAAAPIWSFAPRISLPIFQGGRNWANLMINETERDIAIAQYEKAIQVAFKEVADELATRATLNQQLAAQASLVKASNDAYIISQARYDKGIDNFLLVLDAQRSQYQAQQSLIETRKQRLVNTVNLYKVLGGGQVMQEEAIEVLPEEGDEHALQANEEA
ncbi:MAG: efflux transporter outer membrane subunit [Alphaproteobacteria bacterium]|nr:efflux transporter outer membrane subunit [Alphaproteobacteria bacterium]